MNDRASAKHRGRNARLLSLIDDFTVEDFRAVLAVLVPRFPDFVGEVVCDWWENHIESRPAATPDHEGAPANAWVVVSFPDQEALAAVRISNVKVFRGGPPAIDGMTQVLLDVAVERSSDA